VISTGSRIIGAGHYQPPKVLTNDDLSKIVDTNDEWIRSRVGIAARHIAGDDDPVDAMAAKAASAEPKPTSKRPKRTPKAIAPEAGAQGDAG